jgi:DNA polymerase-4
LRLRQEKLKGKIITLKIRNQRFKTFTKTLTLAKATNFSDKIYRAIKKLLKDFNLGDQKVRLVGIKVSKLIAQEIQDTIFNEDCDKKRENTHKAIDIIQRKFGSGAIRRAGGMFFRER